MMRSSEDDARAAARAPTRRSPRGGVASLKSFGTAEPFPLATVPPRDQSPERQVQTAEAQREQPVAPCRRREERDDAQRDEAESHDRNDADRIGAAGHHC